MTNLMMLRNLLNNYVKYSDGHLPHIVLINVKSKNVMENLSIQNYKCMKIPKNYKII